MKTEIKVGWYAFAGGKFSPDHNAYSNLQGVVAWLCPNYIDPLGRKGLIITPEAVREIWSNKCFRTEIGSEEDGPENTERLLIYGRKHEVSFPSAEWCYLYSKNGVKPGEGFLPALMEIKRIVANRDVVNLALDKIGGVPLDGFIWSSSEFGKYRAWGVYANGDVSDGYKLCSFCARCVIAF